MFNDAFEKDLLLQDLVQLKHLKIMSILVHSFTSCCRKHQFKITMLILEHSVFCSAFLLLRVDPVNFFEMVMEGGFCTNIRLDFSAFKPAVKVIPCMIKDLNTLLRWGVMDNLCI